MKCCFAVVWNNAKWGTSKNIEFFAENPISCHGRLSSVYLVSHPTFWLFGLTKLNHCSLWLYRLVPFGSKNSMAKWRACSKPFFWVRGSQAYLKTPAYLLRFTSHILSQIEQDVRMSGLRAFTVIICLCIYIYPKIWPSKPSASLVTNCFQIKCLPEKSTVPIVCISKVQPQISEHISQLSEIGGNCTEMIVYNWLVVEPTPLKNMKASWDD